MPFGLDGLCWRLMGEGVGWMTSIAVWVTSFPGALGRVAAFGAAPLLLCTSGLVVLCLFKTPLRLIGAVLIGGAIGFPWSNPAATYLHSVNGLRPTPTRARWPTVRLAKGSDAMRQAVSASCATARWSPSPRRSKPSRRTAAEPCYTN